MYALKGNAFSSMDGRFGEVVQLEVRHGFQGGYGLTQGAETLAFPPLIQVPIDKFPTVLDIFDVAATPSFLAIKEGQVYFEVRASAGSSLGRTADCRPRATSPRQNIGLCKESWGKDSNLRHQVYEFYSQIVPSRGGLFGQRQPDVVSQVIDSSESPGVKLSSGQVQWGRKRPVDEEDGRDISSKRPKAETTTTSTTQDYDEETDLARALEASIEQSGSVEPAAGPQVTSPVDTLDPDAQEEDEDEELQRALYLSQQESQHREDAPSSINKGKQRETIDPQG